MTGTKLYIGNIGSSASRQQLRELFAGYGEVLDVTIIGRNAFGFIEMGEQTEAEAAKTALNGYSLEGKDLVVNDAKPTAYNRGRNYRR